MHKGQDQVIWLIALKRILLPTMHILLPNYTSFKKHKCDLNIWYL